MPYVQHYDLGLDLLFQVEVEAGANIPDVFTVTDEPLEGRPILPLDDLERRQEVKSRVAEGDPSFDRFLEAREHSRKWQNELRAELQMPLLKGDVRGGGMMI